MARSSCTGCGGINARNEMKFLAAVVFALLSLASLTFAINATASLQAAQPDHAQTISSLPYTLGFLVFGAASIYFFVKVARRGL